MCRKAETLDHGLTQWFTPIFFCCRRATVYVPVCLIVFLIKMTLFNFLKQFQAVFFYQFKFELAVIWKWKVHSILLIKISKEFFWLSFPCLHHRETCLQLQQPIRVHLGQLLTPESKGRGEIQPDQHKFLAELSEFNLDSPPHLNLPVSPPGPGHPGAETHSRRAAEQVTYQTPDRVWPAGRPKVSQRNSAWGPFTKTNVYGAGPEFAAKAWIN